MSETGATVVIQEVEVTEKAARRQFSAEYKRKILKEADACTREGELGDRWREKHFPKIVAPAQLSLALG